MDKVLATKVIDNARFYMSGDNCQPFRYRFNITTQTFHIDYLADQARHALVYDDSTITISLGMLLEYLKISLQHHSFDIELSFNFNGFSVFKNQTSVCKVKLTKYKNQKDHSDLYSSLLNRITNRGIYQSGSFDDIDINQINQNLTYSQCKLLQDASNKTLDFFASCDCAVWLSKRLGLDIMNSVSFIKNPVTGLPWRNLGLSAPEVFPIKLIQLHHSFYDLFKAIGASLMMKIGQRKLWNSAKSALIFTYNDNLNTEQKTIAGMEMAECMLQLTQKGYAFQPSTLSAEMLNVSVKSENNLINSTAMKHTFLIAESKIQRETLGIVQAEVQWILRVGKPTNIMNEKSKTNRLTVSKTLSFDE
ncbi:hypothetical protein [Paraglaciecola psychrophila]|uniref:Uncharacterized protein n=1 Tax=Paraglaciecola psychrophila 170 TaxID=1129794 RepID=K6ZTH6_9ALTE|nr:hypothetical protein [Paraglaciecola psychrophila]AGH46273.1 hypothetical protein C427_4168 [Paraglaciecola psychrophila 170]GAC39206.1 hypothetical protein GPSY_3595 [Paraglaciecola psychrophila 170]